MGVADRLKAHRERMKYSQTEIAEKLNVSRQAVSRWENGWGYPDLDNLVALSELYNVTVDELLKGKNEENKNDNISIEQNDEKREIERFNVLPEELIIGALAVITCSLPFFGLLLNILLIGYCITKKKEISIVFKMILLICLLVNILNSYVYLDLNFLHMGKVTIEKVI